jgi:hypothetical protein
MMRDDERRWFGRTAAALAVFFCIITFPLWRAPLFGEDLLEIAPFYREGWSRFFADCFGPRAGWSTVRFYRPVPSLSFALQTSISFDAGWLRAANLAVYFAGALSAVAVARMFQFSRLASTFVAIWILLFPGGALDWCWVIGRVDAFSFGFAMVALWLYLGRGAWSGAASALALALACLSKETGFAFVPICIVAGLALHGRSTWRRASGPILVGAALFAIRWFALGGSLGGYVGASRDGGWAVLSPVVAWRSWSLMVAPAEAPWVATATIGMVGLVCAVRGRRRFDPPTRAAAIALALGAVVAYAAPARVVADTTVLSPSFSRVFPASYAFCGMFMILWVDRAGFGAIANALLFATLLFFPARGFVKMAIDVAEAGRVLQSEVARAAAGAVARKDAPVILVAGLPGGWPPGGSAVPMFNQGLPQRFRPPFFSTGLPPVWPLRPVIEGPAGARLVTAEGGELAKCIVPPADPRTPMPVGVEPAGVRVVAIQSDAIPAFLSGNEAQRMQEGTFDRALALPSVQGARWLRVAVFTSQGYSVAETEDLAPTWKKLLTLSLAGGEGVLYQIPGLAVDTGDASFFLRFDWLDERRKRLAESGLIEVAMDRAFEQFVRREADGAFGIRHGTR